MSKSDAMRKRLLGEMPCACPTLEQQLRAELEQRELPVCEQHDPDGALRQRAEADRADYEKRKAALDEVTAPPAVDPLHDALISKLNASPGEIARAIGIPATETDQGETQ